MHYSHISHFQHTDISNSAEPLVHADKPTLSYRLHHIQETQDPLGRHWMLWPQPTVKGQEEIE